MCSATSHRRCSLMLPSLDQLSTLRSLHLTTREDAPPSVWEHRQAFSTVPNILERLVFLGTKCSHRTVNNEPPKMRVQTPNEVRALRTYRNVRLYGATPISELQWIYCVRIYRTGAEFLAQCETCAQRKAWTLHRRRLHLFDHQTQAWRSLVPYWLFNVPLNYWFST